jgi:hypothetical protein
MEKREFQGEIPVRMAALPVDERGYPVPWFVQWIEGKPEFRVMDRTKFRSAIRERLCWVCGGRLGVNFTFVTGPMCGINRTTAEPPSHRECALWSARNCPFLSNPKMVRREDGLSVEIRESVAGISISRNPGVTMLWHARNYDTFNMNGVLIQMGEPESVDWLTCGRKATRAEVLESIESGIPTLVAAARQEKGGIEFLYQARARFEKWLPPQERPE